MRIYQHELRVSSHSIEEKSERVYKAINQAIVIGRIMDTTIKMKFILENIEKGKRIPATLKVEPGKDLNVISKPDYLSIQDWDGVVKLYFHWDNLLSVSITTAR